LRRAVGRVSDSVAIQVGKDLEDDRVRIVMDLPDQVAAKRRPMPPLALVVPVPVITPHALTVSGPITWTSVRRNDAPISGRDRVVTSIASPLFRSRMPFAIVRSVPRPTTVAPGLNRANPGAPVPVTVVEPETE